MSSQAPSAPVMPCLITKWIKSLVHLIQVILSRAWIVSLKSSLRRPFTSLPAPPRSPPRNGLWRKEKDDRLLLAPLRSRCCCSSLLGAPRKTEQGWLPRLGPCSCPFLPRGVVSAGRGYNSPDNGLQTRGPRSLQKTWSCSGARAPGLGVPPQTQLAVGTSPEPVPPDERESHTVQAQIWPLAKTGFPHGPWTVRGRKSVSCGATVVRSSECK